MILHQLFQGFLKPIKIVRLVSDKCQWSFWNAASTVSGPMIVYGRTVCFRSLNSRTRQAADGQGTSWSVQGQLFTSPGEAGGTGVRLELKKRAAPRVDCGEPP